MLNFSTKFFSNLFGFSGGATAVRPLRSPNRFVPAFRFPAPSRGATAVRLLRPFNGTVRFPAFPNQSGGVTAFQLVAPPGPRCAGSTSATRNLKNLDPCSRLSPLRKRRTPLEVCPPVGSRIPALHDARDRYDGIDAHSPGSSPGERWSIFVADTPSPRRLRTRPSQGRSRIRRSRRSFPRWPVKAWRLGRPRVPSLGSRQCFPSCDGEPPPPGSGPHERPTSVSGQTKKWFQSPVRPSSSR
jgi:hypothetical protein